MDSVSLDRLDELSRGYFGFFAKHERGPEDANRFDAHKTSQIIKM
jgi:hypothetical protein